MALVSFRLEQISGKIHNIQISNTKMMRWNIYMNAYKSGTPEFEVQYFQAQIDDLKVIGCFTDIVFKENEDIEVILCFDVKRQFCKLLALKTSNNILHIDPHLHSFAQLFDFKEFLEKWFIPIVLMLVGGNILMNLWLDIEIQLWDMLLFSCFILAIVYFLNPLKMNKDSYYRNLSRKMWQMPMFQELSAQQVSQTKYFYKMKEYIIDLNKLF